MLLEVAGNLKLGIFVEEAVPMIHLDARNHLHVCKNYIWLGPLPRSKAVFFKQGHNLFLGPEITLRIIFSILKKRR